MHKKKVSIVILVWIINLLICELIWFRMTAPTFPKHPLAVHNIVVVGDPQLTDHESYPYMKQYPNTLFSRFIAFMCDLYMRKNFVSLLLANVGAVDAIFVTGDMFDSGRYMDDQQFDHAVKRWDRLFKQPGDQSIPVYYVPGNHDIHLSSDLFRVTYFQSNLRHVIERYKGAFGDLNYETQIPSRRNEDDSQYKFSFIVINSLYLDVTGQRRHLMENAPGYDQLLLRYRDQAWQFITATLNKQQSTSEKIILFSHIPLFRTNTKSKCGKYGATRSWNGKPGEDTIDFNAGPGYRNTLTDTSTRDLFKTRRMSNVVRVISGDDHSNCEHDHTDDFNLPVVENTVGTFSFMQGTVNPSVGLLQTRSDGTVDFEAHFLPNQYLIYAWYGFAAVCTILYLLYCARYDLTQQLRTVKEEGYEEDFETSRNAPVSPTSPISRGGSMYQRRDLMSQNPQKLIQHAAILKPSLNSTRYLTAILSFAIVVIIPFSAFLLLSVAWFTIV